MQTQRALSPWISCAVASLMALSACTRRGHPDPEVKPPRGGTVREITLQSQRLGEARTVLVRLPAGYHETDARYPVLVLLDGEWFFNLVSADVELLSECSYIDPHPAPRMIVVGIVNVDRNRDFTPTFVAQTGAMKFPTSGGAGPFRSFVLEEVVPLIDREFRTSPYRVLAGWSLGGLFTIDTLLRAPQGFNGYIAVSPSLWWDEGATISALPEAAQVLSETDSHRLVVTLGSQEHDTMVSRSTRTFMDRLATSPLPAVTPSLETVEGMGHNFSPKLAFFQGLATLFSDLHLPPAVLDQGLSAIDAYYARVSAEYRFPVPVPEAAYRTLGWRLYEEERAEEAGEVFRAWANRHPESATAVASLGSYSRLTGRTAEAAELLRRAIEIERASPSPRREFINDLEKDLSSLPADS